MIGRQEVGGVAIGSTVAIDTSTSFATPAADWPEALPPHATRITTHAASKEIILKFFFILTFASLFLFIYVFGISPEFAYLDGEYKHPVVFLVFGTITDEIAFVISRTPHSRSSKINNACV
jgi:hypothetical protein